MKYTLLLFLFVLLSVTANAQLRIDPKYVKELKGTWVKTSVERDTLVFKMQKGLEHTFYLAPERSTSPPRQPQGAYTYSISNDSITTHWLYSSHAPARPPKHYFKLDTRTNTLTIGNFYNAPGEGRYLRFVKVEQPKKPVIKSEN